MKGWNCELPDGSFLRVAQTESGKCFTSLAEFCKKFGVKAKDVESAICDCTPETYQLFKEMQIVPKTGPEVNVINLEAAVIASEGKATKHQDFLPSLDHLYSRKPKREREEPKVSDFIMEIIEQKVDQYRKKLIKETIEELGSAK